MTPPTIGLGVAQSHRPGFGCAHPTHASLPLPWESDLRSSSVHSWSRTQGLGRHSPSMLLGCLQQLQGVKGKRHDDSGGQSSQSSQSLRQTG